MANVKRTKSMIEFWFSGAMTPDGTWLIATCNLPVHTENEQVLPINIKEGQEIKRGVGCKTILQICHEKSAVGIECKPVAFRCRLFSTNAVNIGCYNIVSEVDAKDEKGIANCAKVGFDLQKFATFTGFPVGKVKLSTVAKKIFDAYGIDLEAYKGEELPFESREEIKARKQRAKQSGGLTATLEELSDVFGK